MQFRWLIWPVATAISLLFSFFLGNYLFKKPLRLITIIKVRLMIASISKIFTPYVNERGIAVGNHRTF